MNSAQVIVISGGSRGLGYGLVTHFLQAGHQVATFSRSSTDLIQALVTQDPREKKFLWKSVNMTEPDALKQFTTDVMARFGRIDTLINNAGMGSDGLLTLMRATEIEQSIDLNLKGTIMLTQACTKVMLRQRSGCIINISSVNAIRGHAGVGIYSATKAALDGLTRSLARELGPKNIRINSVAPGYFESDMVSNLTDEQKQRIIRRTPLKRLAQINDIVSVIQFLSSPDAKFITGQTLVVDGGITC